jgi:hypothetical protein
LDLLDAKIGGLFERVSRLTDGFHPDAMTRFRRGADITYESISGARGAQSPHLINLDSSVGRGGRASGAASFLPGSSVSTLTRERETWARSPAPSSSRIPDPVYENSVGRGSSVRSSTLKIKSKLVSVIPAVFKKKHDDPSNT